VPVESINELFNLLQMAQQNSGEALGLYYLVRVFLELIRQTDNNILVISSVKYKEVITFIMGTFREVAANNKDDELTMEICLVEIELFEFISQFSFTHDFFTGHHIVKQLVNCLSF
jgi:hypothetical protein